MSESAEGTPTPITRLPVPPVSAPAPAPVGSALLRPPADAAEAAGHYGDPRAGSEYTAPTGAALGPRRDPVRLPENDLVEGDRFDFDDPEVVRNFESLVIRTQIPGYDLMRLRSLQIGYQFVRPRTAVLDLGTSRAKMIRDLVQVAHEEGRPDLVDTVTYVGVDTEDRMLDAARSEVNGLFDSIGRTEREAEARVRLLKWDLREGIPPVNGYGAGYSLVTSVLTLQFVPVEFRQAIVRDIYDGLTDGGALVLVEKVIGTSHRTDRILVDAYHDSKRRNGIDEEGIRKKANAISGSLVPNRSEENRYLLEQAGFSRFHVDTFWRDLNFEAVIAIK